jgi:hypothetical protein
VIKDTTDVFHSTAPAEQVARRSSSQSSDPSNRMAYAICILMPFNPLKLCNL